MSKEEQEALEKIEQLKALFKKKSLN